MIQGLLEGAGIPSLLRRPVSELEYGPHLGFGVLAGDFGGGGPQPVMVHANRAEQARALLAETLVEDPDEAWPESANAKHLAAASGGRARNYGVAGAYARAMFWSFGVMAVAFGVFLLLRLF
jgi:hypothetical protein